MKFTYDPAKSKSNQSKHGINFEQAQQLWLDPLRVEIEAQSTTEPRFMIIGKIEGKYWSAIVTYRHQTIRIISVRRSRQEEIRVYES
ncbi:BrnT family toxin [Euhalothece natronophila Z-M001]|uniref:BrnT family toxin n=1 Tax=Euhalothece natronophila Z-M001 TaxID=522448 RepID=A0A5B8NQI1_9CHRO|nr:BrnT family toxin [Euhalothece natronophila]QDZ41238.1 BrnT family toxin [Euhalothece natronophila Z-M001]